MKSLERIKYKLIFIIWASALTIIRKLADSVKVKLSSGTRSLPSICYGSVHKSTAFGKEAHFLSLIHRKESQIIFATLPREGW